MLTGVSFYRGTTTFYRKVRARCQVQLRQKISTRHRFVFIVLSARYNVIRLPFSSHSSYHSLIKLLVWMLRRKFNRWNWYLTEDRARSAAIKHTCPIDSFLTIEKYKWRSNESHESTPNENPIILAPGWNSMEPDEIMIRCNFTPIVPIKWMLHLGSCQLSEQYLIQRTT